MFGEYCVHSSKSDLVQWLTRDQHKSTMTLKFYMFLWHFEATDAKIYTKLYKGSFKVQKSTNTNADLADLPATTLCISLSTWGKYFNDYAIHVHKKGMVKTWKIA